MKDPSTKSIACVMRESADIMPFNFAYGVLSPLSAGKDAANVINMAMLFVMVSNALFQPQRSAS